MGGRGVRHPKLDLLLKGSPFLCLAAKAVNVECRLLTIVVFGACAGHGLVGDG